MNRINMVVLQVLGERLASKIIENPITGCWDFQGCITKTGYGRIKREDSKISDWAHRVYYQVVKGEIPKGLVIDHLCRNRKCVNPDHLEPVTNRENTIRGLCPEVTRERHKSKTHCKNGHPFFGDNLSFSSEGRRMCLICTKAYHIAYRERNREKIKAYHRERHKKGIR